MNNAYLIASAAAFGSRVIPSEETDRAFGMPIGKLKNRAGIRSFTYAAENEDEGVLGTRACAEALKAAGEAAGELDCVLAASETHHAYPSLSAVLHGSLELPENCSALDLGGGCLALLHIFAVAQALLETGRAKKVLVATADVHSRALGPGRTAGEFGGLFGDGASAFLLASEPVAPDIVPLYRLGEFSFGCAAKYASAISVNDSGHPRLDVQFAGDSLSRAAVNYMERVLEEVEHRSSIPRAHVGAFATHQPNPRLVALLAKQLGVPAEMFPPIAETCGNLGSSMCGAALHAALRAAATHSSEHRRPIFLAGLGPGLLFGGGWLVPA